jgi:hypothetical protein
MCVERIALTLTSPDDQTVWGSFVGSKVIALIRSAGPPAVRSLTSAWRCATSPDSMNASATCARYFLQLTVWPCGATTSALHTTSNFPNLD